MMTKLGITMKQYIRLPVTFFLLMLGLGAGMGALAQTTSGIAETSFSAEHIKQALDEKRWLDAEKMLAPLLGKEPNNSFIAFDLAQVYENTDRKAEAQSIYTAIAALSPVEREKFVVFENIDGKQSMKLLSTLARNKLQAFKTTTPAPAAVASLATAPRAVDPIMVAVAPAPVPVPVVTPVKQDTASVQEEQIAAFDAWLMAWKTKNLKAYFESYVPEFKGKMTSSAKWKKSRTKNILGKEKIEIKASNMAFKKLSADKWTISFMQTYKAKSITAVSQKTLVMRQVLGRWLIESETTSK